MEGQAAGEVTVDVFDAYASIEGLPPPRSFDIAQVAGNSVRRVVQGRTAKGAHVLIVEALEPGCPAYPIACRLMNDEEARGYDAWCAGGRIFGRRRRRRRPGTAAQWPLGGLAPRLFADAFEAEFWLAWSFADAFAALATSLRRRERRPVVSSHRPVARSMR